MKRSGSADLPLHYGSVPKWITERMAKLGKAVTETIVMDYGKEGMLRRLSDPFWFLFEILFMQKLTQNIFGKLQRCR